MAIDLDQLIRDADPAADLHVATPDPTGARTALKDRPSAPRHVRRGLAVPALSLVVVAAVIAVIVVAVGGHHQASPSPASPPPAIGKVLQQTSDPVGGLPWGVELIKGSGARVCLRVGRVKNGQLGAVGLNGAGFHRLSSRDRQPGQDACAYPDANGNVFASVVEPNTSFTGNARAHTTTSANQRTIEYGLYGPDLQSVTYVGSGGRLFTEPAGRGGAFVVVVPQTSRICRAGSCAPIDGGTSSGIGIGPIVKLTYRDGSTCQLAPGAGTACPTQGRVLAPVTIRTPVASSQDVATTVTATPIPARAYCEPRHELVSWTPCDHGTPPGDLRVPGTVGRVVNGRKVAPEEIVLISFTARLATGTRRRYEYSYTNPCGGGGGGGPVNYKSVHAGQHIQLKAFSGQLPWPLHRPGDLRAQNGRTSVRSSTDDRRSRPRR